MHRDLNSILAFVLDESQIRCAFSFTQNGIHFIKPILETFVYGIGSIQVLEIRY